MDWTRRTLVGGIASATVPLAGCSLDSPSDDPTDSGSGGEFEQVQVDGQTLVVGLGELSADTVNVIAPDGTAFASQSVPQGATTVTFDIGLSYAPGEYRVVASTGESTIAETTLTIAPDLEILEVGVGANHLDRMPTGLGNTKSAEALVTVINRGNGPAILEKILFLGGVPNPTTDLQDADEEEASGIFNKAEGASEVTQLVILGNQKDTLYTSRLPFSFHEDGVSCSSDEQTGKFRVVLSTRIEGASATGEYSISYTRSSESGECNVRIN
jgi:hypothetical protein